MSTPYFVTRGELLCYFTKYTIFRKFYTNVEQAEKEEFPEFTIYTEPFEKCETPINDIVPPYRKILKV